MWCVCAIAADYAVAQTTGQDPICPAEDAVTTYPAYADVGSSPNVEAWKKLALLPSNCHALLERPPLLTVAIAATFLHSGTIEDVALRLGAISRTQGLKYWSATDKKWRELVSTASALESADKKSNRDDFTAKEILSGKTLHFAQNDTRSWGLNVFSMSSISASADHLTVTSQNTKSVRIGPVKLFDVGDLQTVVFITRAHGNSWYYYSLAIVKDSALPAPDKSLINRQAAMYRFLTGKQTDKEPPLSP